jgi:Hsp70 protein
VPPSYFSLFSALLCLVVLVLLQTGGVGVRVTYNEQSHLFSVEAIVAMLLNKAAEIAASANAGVPVAEAVISIPGWYTDRMRHAMLVSVSFTHARMYMQRQFFCLYTSCMCTDMYTCV